MYHVISPSPAGVLYYSSTGDINLPTSSKTRGNINNSRGATGNIFRSTGDSDILASSASGNIGAALDCVGTAISPAAARRQLCLELESRHTYDGCPH